MNRIRQILAAIAMMALLVAPQSAAWAQEPVASPVPEVEQTVVPSTPTDEHERPTLPAVEAATPGSTEAPQRSMVQPAAAGDELDVTNIFMVWDDDARYLQVDFAYLASGLFPGEVVTFSFDAALIKLSDGNYPSFTGEFVVDADMGTITFTANDTAVEAGEAVFMQFWGGRPYVCDVSDTPYDLPAVHLTFSASNGWSGSQDVIRTCPASPPASEVVLFQVVHFDLDDTPGLDIRLRFGSGSGVVIPQPGSSVTVTYPTAEMTLSSTPVPVQGL